MFGVTRNRAHLLYVTPLALLLLLAALVPVYAGRDLDVAYISRSGLYWKYTVTEITGLDPDIGVVKPILEGDELTKQRWPSNGEIITYTAVIKNPGNTSTGTFAYKWYWDNVEVASGTLPSIAAGGQVTTTYQHAWDSEQNNHNIKFSADPSNLIAEEIETNNIRDDRTNSLSFRFHVVQSVYDWMQTNARSYDPNLASFEDWAQKQLGYLNQWFPQAIWPNSPNGILERIRLDEVVIEPEDYVDPDPYACHAPADPNWDCRWGFTTAEYPQIWIENPDFLSGPYYWTLHEWGHQMGMHDVYNFTIYPDRNQVNPNIGHQVTRGREVMCSAECEAFSDYIALAMNSNLHKRRGYFGEYMYDLPTTCKVRLLDAYQRPITNATIKFYQDDQWTVDTVAEYTLTTDASGVCTLPNGGLVYGDVTTGTGHLIHDNPWGLFHLNGYNTLWYCDITSGSYHDAQWLEVVAYNIAYRAGNTSSYTYDMQSTIVNGGRPTTNNLYGVKIASSTMGHAVGASGKTLRWNGTTWSSISSSTTNNLRAVDTSGTSYAYAVGDGGKVIRYASGAWATRTPCTGNLKAVACLSSTTLIVGGENGALYKSTNSGSSWTPINVTGNTINSIDFYNSSVGIMVCNAAQVWYTTNGGTTWYQGPVLEDDLSGCCMASATEAYCCSSGGGDAWKSTDGGATWTKFQDGSWYDPWLCVDIKAGGNGWMAGSLQTQYGTAVVQRQNACRNINIPIHTAATGDTIYAVSCINSAGSQAWAVGKGGLLLKLTTNAVMP
jgi:hypothetical protein